MKDDLIDTALSILAINQVFQLSWGETFVARVETLKQPGYQPIARDINSVFVALDTIKNAAAGLIYFLKDHQFNPEDFNPEVQSSEMIFKIHGACSLSMTMSDACEVLRDKSFQKLDFTKSPELMKFRVNIAHAMDGIKKRGKKTDLRIFQAAQLTKMKISAESFIVTSTLISDELKYQYEDHDLIQLVGEQLTLTDAMLRKYMDSIKPSWEHLDEVEGSKARIARLKALGFYK